MENVVLLLGSNQGDRQRLLCDAADLLGVHVGPIVSLTEMISSAPFGFESDNEFLNQGLVIATSLEPMEVMRITQKIEATLGRDRTKEIYNAQGQRIYHDRPIDIDILYYGSQIINTPELIIPHPRIHQRPFVMDIIRVLSW